MDKQKKRPKNGLSYFAGFNSGFSACFLSLFVIDSTLHEVPAGLGFVTYFMYFVAFFFWLKPTYVPPEDQRPMSYWFVGAIILEFFASFIIQGSSYLYGGTILAGIMVLYALTALNRSEKS